MLNVAEITNPFDPKLEIDGLPWMTMDCISVNACRALLFPDQIDFDLPTLVLVDGAPALRGTWNKDLPDGAKVIFLRIPTGTVAIIIAAVVVVAAVAAALVIPTLNPAAIGAADAPGQRQNGATVYSLSGEKNQIKLNNCIEACYGKNRMWPAYAARPYSTYLNNQQIQFSLFCLGQGAFIIHKMQFEDTPLDKFSDVEVEVIEPGEAFTLFKDNVITSSEVQGIELFGPNEPQYSGVTPAFTANPAGTICKQVHMDVVLPTGLYQIDSVTGKVELESFTVQFEYREIDDLDAPIGDWTILPIQTRTIVPTSPSGDPDDQWPNTEVIITTDDEFTKSSKTLTPQRYTLVGDVPDGRFLIRGQRLDDKNESPNSGNTVVWESLRAFLPSRESYGDVTLVGVRARASNSLNNDAGGRFNVIATRRLPTWDPIEGWSTELVRTRNPIWAFCDIFRAEYGGRLEDAFLSLEALQVLAEFYDTNEITFDYIFDQKSTVWEAARAVARMGRGVPMLNGSRITIVRDKLKTVATAVFNENNIVENSFRLNLKLRSIQEQDGVEVEYQDPETWLFETVLCLIGDDAGDNPELYRLPGCTDRNLAYREGLYYRATQIYNRRHIEFKTGLEGHLPKYGDLIMVGHNVPRWGQTGIVKSVDGLTLTLDVDITFIPAVTHKIVLRKKDGSAYGPVIATASLLGSNIVEVLDELPDEFYFDETHERPLFLFGPIDEDYQQCVVTGVIPEGEDIVSIKAIIYDERVFDGDDAEAPPFTPYANQELVFMPKFPIIEDYFLEVRNVPGTGGDFVSISWPSIPGAHHYIVETSYDSQQHWEQLGASILNTTVNFRVLEDNDGENRLYVRVAGVNVDAGPWANWNGRSDRTEAPADLGVIAVVDTAIEIVFSWVEATRADSYLLQVFNETTGAILRRDVVYGGAYTYTAEMGIEDGLTGTAVRIYLLPRNIRGVSITATATGDLV